MDASNDRDLRPFLDRARWQPAEVAFWLVVVGAFFVFGDYRTLGAQVLVMGCFALSLDLLLGFAGIVTLGQAAFFGHWRLCRRMAGQVRLAGNRSRAC